MTALPCIVQSRVHPILGEADYDEPLFLGQQKHFGNYGWCYDDDRLFLNGARFLQQSYSLKAIIKHTTTIIYPTKH
jgi:hypothetical protein